MEFRRIRARTTAIAAAGLSLAITSPAWADCCDSLFSCAATYVTDGLSCEIETIIDTLHSLSTMITNFIHDIDGQTEGTIGAARQSVADTFNLMQSQSQSSDADLATALSEATALYKQETAIIESEAQSAAQRQSNLTTPASGSTAPPRPPVEARAGSPSTSGGPPLAMTAQRSQDLGPAGGVSNIPLTQKSAVLVGTQVRGTTYFITTPKGTFADAFSRAIDQIQAMKAAGDADLPKVNGFLQQAQNNATAGVAAANKVSDVMNAPLTTIEATISNMITHPWSAFDPSSVVDATEATVTADLSTNMAEMVNDITTDADNSFNAAQPSYDDLLAKAEAAKTLEAIMENAYRLRTPAAANALYAALPKRQFQATDSTGLASASIAGTGMAAHDLGTKFGQRVAYTVIAAKMSTAQQRARLAYKAPNIDQIHVALARFKAERLQGKNLPQPTLAAYKSKLAQQLDSQFKGKSPAAIASARDQLVTQARTHFAKDPDTGNAVVGLLNSEASKRAGVSNAAAANPTMPGQPVATTTAQRSAVTTNAQVGLSAPVSSLNQSVSGGGFGGAASLGAANSALGTTAPGTRAPVGAASGVATSGVTTPGSVATWTPPATANAPVTSVGATRTNPTIPGQPVSAAAPQRATVTAVKPPAGLVTPAVTATAPIAAPINQATTTVWGAAPVQGWTPPAATTVGPVAAPAANPALRFQTVRPAQQTEQTQPAPAVTSP
jgi:hypothetical protein